MCNSLELARTKLTLRHLAEPKHTTLPEAESLCSSLRETVIFLERRIAREKLAIAKMTPVSVDSEFVRVS